MLEAVKNCWVQSSIFSCLENFKWTNSTRAALIKLSLTFVWFYNFLLLFSRFCREAVVLSLCYWHLSITSMPESSLLPIQQQFPGLKLCHKWHATCYMLCAYTMHSRVQCMNFRKVVSSQMEHWVFLLAKSINRFHVNGKWRQMQWRKATPLAFWIVKMLK